MYEAGLLHDILKEESDENFFKYAEKYGVELTPLEKSARKLWHAEIGAEYVKNELGVDDREIINAIRYHTTGRKNMTLSEKILFTADFISADRSYDGVQIMREKAEKSLDEAMIEGLAFTINELLSNKKAIHPDTLDAYNDIILNIKESN